MPLKKTFANSLSAVSERHFNVAGLDTIVHGLDELSPGVQSLSCLYLLHPRLDSKSTMAPLASAFIRDWNSRKEASQLGLVTVSFDQRNHGDRVVTKLANQTWRDGNTTHAQDMFSSYRKHARAVVS
jgi:hypothetical protein